MKQPHPRALDLAAEQERDVEGDVFRFQGVAFGGVHAADGAADALGRPGTWSVRSSGFSTSPVVRVFQPLGQGSTAPTG